jgi:hypothetical protein
MPKRNNSHNVLILKDEKNSKSWNCRYNVKKTDEKEIGNSSTMNCISSRMSERKSERKSERGTNSAKNQTIKSMNGKGN